MADKTVRVTLEALVARYQQKMQEATKTTRDFGDRLMSTGKAFLPVSAAAGALGIALKAAADEWNQGVRALRVGTGAVGADLEKLVGSARTVAGGVTQSFAETGRAMATLATRTGQTGKPLEHLTQQFLNLERITGEATDRTIPAITRLFGDWSVATEHQIGTMDGLFRVSQAAGIEIGRLSELMVQFGSPLRQLGFDLETTAAMFARFEKEGVNIQTALPGLRMALKNFAKDGREPAEALRETIDQIKNAGSVAEANTIAFQVFGVRAGPDLAAAIREGRFELDELIGVMRNGTDTIQQATEDTTTLSERVKMFANRITVALGPVGEFGALVAGAVASIGPLLFGLGALTKAFQGVGVSATVAAGGMRALSGAMLGVPGLFVTASAAALAWGVAQDNTRRKTKEFMEETTGLTLVSLDFYRSALLARDGTVVWSGSTADARDKLAELAHATQFSDEANRSWVRTVEDVPPALKAAGDAVLLFAETEEELAEWRASTSASLANVMGILDELAGKANVSTEKILKAFLRQTQALADYEENWLRLNARDLPDELRVQLAEMGLEGAAIVEQLANANDRKFQRIINKWQKAQEKAAAVTAAIEGIGMALDNLPDFKRINIDVGINTPSELRGTGLIPKFHSGGIFRAPTPGGEGLAILRDRELVMSPAAASSSRPSDGMSTGPTYNYAIRIAPGVIAGRHGAQELAEIVVREIDRTRVRRAS